MHVLNISSDFSRQKIYKNLALSLSNIRNLQQTIYVPVRTKEEIGANQPAKGDIDMQYRLIIKKSDRYFYFSRIKRVYRDILKTLDVSVFQMVHAHFLFTDGGVALKLWEKQNIPYIVAVRNTDINFYFKYAVHLRAYGIKILLNAEKIILLTPSYLDHLLKYCSSEEKESIRVKVKIVPNGVDEGWFENQLDPKHMPNAIPRLLYVGDFTKNKNVPFLIQAKQKYFEHYFLDIVGSEGDDSEKIAKCAENDDKIHLHGRVSDRLTLKKLYRSADILCIMSKYETFGVSYIESLTQGTPVIYTEGQGIDGYFQIPVGMKVSYGSMEGFRSAVDHICTNYLKYSESAIESSQEFKWDQISQSYNNIYTNYGSKD